MSLANHIRDQVVAANDTVWGETLQLLPLTDGRKSSERPARTFSGVLRSQTVETNNMTAGGTDFLSKVASAGSVLRIDRARYADLVIKAQDKIRAVSQPGAPLYIVQHVDDRRHDRLVVHLGDA